MNEWWPDKFCPGCSGPVDAYPACHTWPQTVKGEEQWMSCINCGSAIDWLCSPDDDTEPCGWSWVEGLNPRNPRAAANEASRPSWAPTEIANL